jgi:hypothetical protein
MRPTDSRAQRSSLRGTFVFVVLIVALASGCNKHVFEVQERECSTEDRVLQEIELGGAIDILFVIDDSGSMSEEQQALADGFYKDSCPFLTDAVPYVPAHEKNPTEERLAELAPMCGFIQLLGAFDREFQVGIITTTVDECDNRYGLAPDGWGRRSRRGCLMRATDGDSIFSPSDEGLHDRFRQALASVGTWGSGFERGLDAAQIFLDPDAVRAPGCSDDLDAFLRPEADLAVVFLTDEDDCSRDGPLPEGATLLDDETVYRRCDVPAGEVPVEGEIGLRASTCYEPGAALADVAHYASFLRTRKAPGREVRVAVIGGAARSGTGLSGEGFVAGGCSPGADGQVVSACFESGGQTVNPQVCGADARPGEAACCLADGAHRYFQLADALGGLFSGGSLCAPFSDTLREVAAFLGRTDGVTLSEPPLNPRAVRVRVTRRDGREEIINAVAAGTEAGEGDGWFFETDTQIRFVGPSAPQPGDAIDVAVLVGTDREECTGPTGPTG